MDPTDQSASNFPPVGAICTIRRESGEWRVTRYVFDGLVMKCELQCVLSNRKTSRFLHEITENSTSTYQELNKYMLELTGMSNDEMNTIFDADASFSFDDVDVDLQEPQKKRFKDVSNELVQNLKAQTTEQTTNHQTKWAVKLLKDWMIETGLGHDFEWLPTEELDRVLGHFYAALQTKNGQEYSKSALVGIRAGLNRHLTSPTVGRIINIMKDREFMASNQVLTGIVKSLKREGKDTSTHKEPLEDDDIKKLYASGVFDESKPETLQNKVLFDIISQFGRRGREGLRNLKKSSFVVKHDAKGRKYIQMAYNEADKTHHGIDSKENVKAPRMYESNDAFCPVGSFEKYVKKLNPKLDDFFQRPLIKVTENDETWYAARAVGINTLCNFMSSLSKEAGLSKRYTNHCIRAYISTKLFTAGFSNRAIMSVTGHRNEKSLTSYIKPSEDERQALSRALFPSTSVVEYTHRENDSRPVTSTIPQPPAIENSSFSNALSQSQHTVDVSVLQNRANLNMFSGNVTNSSIQINMYTK